MSSEREAIAAILGHLGEMDGRKLYLPAGYSSMYDYCLGEFRWSRQTTLKRIGAARAARKHPEILAAIAAGRLHVSAVVLIRRYLTPDNARELLDAAAYPAGDVAGVLRRALEVLIRQIERRKFGATDRPRPAQRAAGSRHIPAHVRRAEAERNFGADFMETKRDPGCHARSRCEVRAPVLVPENTNDSADVDELRVKIAESSALDTALPCSYPAGAPPLPMTECARPRDLRSSFPDHEVHVA